MGRRTDIVSIGLSLSLALALFVHVLPTERPSAPKPETVTPPTPLLKTERISVATLDLPPPPPPLTSLPSPAQSPVNAAVVKPLKPAGPAVAKTTVSPLKPSIDPPVSPPQKVAALKPTSETLPPQKSTKVKPLKPTDIPHVEPADAEIAVADEKKSSRREAETKIAPEPANAMAQKKAPTVGQTQASPLIAVGRPLLRLLEHGDGPRIDIAWPTDPRERSALFDTFERCYGMVVALVAESGDLLQRPLVSRTMGDKPRLLQRVCPPIGAAQHTTRTRLVSPHCPTPSIRSRQTSRACVPASDRCPSHGGIA